MERATSVSPAIVSAAPTITVGITFAKVSGSPLSTCIMSWF